MHEFCHRCGGELQAGEGASTFCSHCGCPQLYLQDYEEQTGAPDGDTTGAVPPPHPRQVEWKTAIRCAAAVAGIGSLLSLVAMRVDVVSPVSLVWIMSASMITLGLYQKRRPMAWIDVGVGARIGLVVGICLALGLGTAMAGAGLVRRYGLHSMGNFDAQMAEQIQTLQKTIQQQPVTSATAGMVKFVNSPEMRAGLMLTTFAMATAVLVVLSTLGGAFAGLLRTRRGPV